MAMKDKKNGVWNGKWIGKFQFQNKRHRKRGFETKGLASEWEAAEKRRLKYPHTVPPPEPPRRKRVSFQSLVLKYTKDCEARMQPNTIGYKSDYLAQFLAKLGSPTFAAEDVTKVQASEHIASIQAEGGGKLANRHLKELKAVYNWGIKQGIVSRNPAAMIEPYPEDPYVKYVPPAKDIDAVILAASPEEGDFLLVLYNLAARRGEVIRMVWDDVNFEHGWVRLWTRKRKRGQLEANMLPMTKDLRAVLKHLWKKRDTECPYVFSRDGKQLTRDSDFIRHMMERLCDRAQVKRFGFHAIRHHIGSILLDSGKATTKEIQIWLRHKRLSTTETYLHQLDPGLSRVVGVLEGDGEDKRGQSAE